MIGYIGMCSVRMIVPNLLEIDELYVDVSTQKKLPRFENRGVKGIPTYHTIIISRTDNVTLSLELHYIGSQTCR